MNQSNTIEALCNELSVKPDTMRVIWKRKGLSGFDRKRAYTDSERAVIISHFADRLQMKAPVQRPAKPASLPAPVREPRQQKTAQPASEQSGFDWTVVRANTLSALLIGIVAGHAGLVWYDCAIQWATPGTIGGGIAFVIVITALLLAADKTRVRTSEFALYFVALVDIGAWWVHFPTFQNPGIQDEITGVFTAFLCACSWVALYLYRDSKID